MSSRERKSANATPAEKQNEADWPFNGSQCAASGRYGRCRMPGTMSPQVYRVTRRFCRWHWDITQCGEVDDAEEFDRWLQLNPDWLELGRMSQLWDMVNGREPYE